MVDLAWPAGVQEGYSQPVALVLQEDKEQNRILNQAGYRYFTSVKDLRAYLEKLVGISSEEEDVLSGASQGIATLKGSMPVEGEQDFLMARHYAMEEVGKRHANYD